MAETVLTLGRKPRRISEPVFRQLRIIIDAYNTLPDGDEPHRRAAVDTILRTLTNGAVRLRQLSQSELKDFLQALPDLCGLKPVASGGPGRPMDWGHIYFHLSSSLGWTYDYIDNYMTLSRLEEARGYFEKHPPTHQLVAAYMGYAAKDKQEGSAFLQRILAQAKAKGALN